MPAPTKRARFSVHPVALVIGLLMLPCWAWLTLRVNQNDVPYALGSATGTWLAQFGTALVGAWIAWFIFRRSRVASTATFVVLMFMCVGGSSLRVVKDNAERRDDALKGVVGGIDAQFEDDLTDVRQRMLDQIDEQGYADPDPDLAERYADELESRAGELGESDAAALREQAAWLREFNAQHQPYNDRIDDFSQMGGTDPATLTSAADIESRIELIAELKGMNAEIKRYLRTSPQRHESAMIQAGVPAARARAFADGFSRGANFSTLVKIRELDDRIFDAMTDYLRVLLDHHGTWEIDANGAVWFDESVPDDAVMAFNDHADRIDQHTDAQLKLQRETLSVQP